MKNFFLILLLLCASACSTVRQLPAVTDSTKVEVHVVEKIVKDTAWFELPVIVEKVATLDTASVLENKYAQSEASVSGGVLTHSLALKPVKEPVIVENKEIVRDSIVFRDRVIREDVYYEKPFTRWQKFRLSLGSIFLVLIVIAMLYLFLKFTNLLNLKRL